MAVLIETEESIIRNMNRRDYVLEITQSEYDQCRNPDGSFDFTHRGSASDYVEVVIVDDESARKPVLIPKMRFDVCYPSEHASIEPHFCREWDEDGGCYGTNPEHGYSFEEACDEMARWHQQQVDLWRKREHPLCLYYLEPDDEGQD